MSEPSASVEPSANVRPPVQHDSARLRELIAELRAQADAERVEQSLMLAEALLTRADSARESVSQLLISRAQSVLSKAEQALARPDESGENSGVRAPSPLALLLAEMREQHSDKDEQPLGELDQKMLEQTERLVGAQKRELSLEPDAESSNTAGDEPAEEHKPLQKSLLPIEPPKPPELRAARQFRQLQGRHAKRRKVQFALDNRPEDPGPLNPDMLAVQILRETQDASPAYLERIVSYLETLAALEQVGANRVKKTARAAKAESAKKRGN